MEGKKCWGLRVGSERVWGAQAKMNEAEEQLCEAARKGDTEKVRSLIDSGADVSHFDGEGLNPLMHAAKHGHAPVLTLLLSAGAPWNALSPSNLSAGDYAMQEGHNEAFELLVNAGTLSLSTVSFSILSIGI